jgi:hypothetical protein
MVWIVPDLKTKNIIMKTKYLDNEIELLNSIKRNDELSDYGREKLIEFNAIKQALTIPVVVGQSEQLTSKQFWKMAQKYNADDFIQMVKEIEG